MSQPIKTSLAAWLSVRGSIKALDFYKAAFGAVEAYRLDVPDGVVARLSVQGAEFWISEASENLNVGAASSDATRMIMTVEDPDATFQRALNAGAKEIFPVGEQHGWRLGRLADPFGHHWEIGKEV